MKINKKQIVMLSLSLVMCLAVFLNWKFIQNQETQPQNDDVLVNQNSENIPSENEDGDKVLGQAQYVSATAKDGEEYFTQSRLAKKQSKDEAIELLKTVISNESSTDEAIAKANDEISSIASRTEIEGTVEGLIKAKGFNDCVVYINSDLVSVVVSVGSEGLDNQKAAQINEIVVTQTGVSAANIKIVEVK